LSWSSARGTRKIIVFLFRIQGVQAWCTEQVSTGEATK